MRTAPSAAARAASPTARTAVPPVASLVADEALPPPGRLPPPWPGRTVRLDGAALHVRDTPPGTPGDGAAEPALYVHGLGGSSTNWTDLAALLAGRLDGQAIDLPGFGRSEPVGGYAIPAVARRVARWIDASGRGPVHLFGNSLGGTVAVQVAATHPDLVRTLTLISPAMPFLDPRRSAQGRFAPLAFLPRADRIAARRIAAVEPAEMARLVIEACFGDPSVLPEQRLAEAIEEMRSRATVPWYPGAYVGSLRAIVRSFLRAYLPGAGSLWRLAGSIDAPTLVVAGRLDRLVDVRVAPRVAGLVPDGRLLMLDGVGHLAQMEAPRLVARAFLAMLDETTAAPRPGTPGPLPPDDPAWEADHR